MVDQVKVFRIAHQLLADHGRNAYLYAARLSKEAEEEGKTNEAEFWKSVASAVTPRTSN